LNIGVTERKFHFEIASPGGRLDQQIAAHISDVSRNRIQNLIRSGLISVDDIRIVKPGYSLKGGERVSVVIPAPKPSDLIPEDIPLDIIHEDRNVVIVNKPAGMVVHPSAGHDSGTLVHAILAHAPDIEGIGEVLRPGVVHRLDKDTSGIIVFAKSDAAHQQLQAQFKEREVKKVYHALVDGAPPSPSGKIETHIGRDPKHRQKMAVVSKTKGREASTIYHTEELFSQHSFLDVHPRTGRTHQIRVHLAFIGCPVVGDRFYGKRGITLPVSRHLLHASQLEITLPEHDEPSIHKAPLPRDFLDVLVTLREDQGSI
jgi:23S rRNA pseudouridine1911/1915/1917 synthase